MKRHVVFIFAVIITSSLLFTAKATAEDILWEGFEGRNNWVMVDWRNAGRGSFKIAKENASEGEKSLKVVMNRERKTDKIKVGVSREGYLNLANANSVVVDVFSETDDGLAVALGFDAGDKGTYYESVKKRLGKGWNRDIVFDLSGNDFKCEASDWKFEKPLGERENITKIHIIIYRPSNVIAPETVYIDNIRIRDNTRLR